MRNSTTCKNCQTSNPIYSLNCLKCNAILRNRIVNIDLWQTLWGLIESPIKTFTTIIQAEHKNFIILMTFLGGLEFLFNAKLFQKLVGEVNNYSPGFFTSFIIAVITMAAFLLCTATLFTFSSKFIKVYSRIKDNYTIFLYALSPQIVAFPILFTIEYAVFGEYWLSFNPSPLLIKPAIAYVLISFEGILLLVSAMLFIGAVYSQTKMKLLSALVGLFITAVYIGLQIYLPL